MNSVAATIQTGELALLWRPWRVGEALNSTDQSPLILRRRAACKDRSYAAKLDV
jgi:hypothetical protein